METDYVILQPPETLSLAVPCSHTKNIHLQTWISPDRLTAKQTDHAMTSRKHAADLNDIRSQRGVKCDSYHFMMRIKYRPKITILFKHQCTGRLRFDISKLQDGTCVKEYHNSIKKIC